MKKLIALTLVVLFAGAGVWYWLDEKKAKDDGIHASGTIEVTQVQLASQVGGRILSLAVQEGRPVHKGDLLARLSLDGVDKDLEMAEAALGVARQSLAVLEKGARSEQISAATAQLELRKVQFEQARKDYERFRNLAERGAVSQREAELYGERMETSRKSVQMAKDELSLLTAGNRAEDIEAARGRTRQAEAAVEKATLLVGYKKVYAPVDGVVLTKNYEEGDVVAPGASLATLGVMERCWVNIYIPSTQLGMIRLGGEAIVQVDSYPDRTFPAVITEISQEAEYNPRLSLTPDQRANVVFRVKVGLDNPEGIMKPGMPADVTF